MMSSLGAYIQHRWYNPSAPRQTAEDVMPYAARMYGLGSVMDACSSVPLPDGSSISPLGDGTRVMPGQAVDIWLLGVRGRRGMPVIGAAYTERDVPIYRVYVKGRPTTVRELRWLVAARTGRALHVRWTSLCALPAKPGVVRAMYDIDEDGNAAGASATLRGMGSIFGSAVGEASEWLDFVKIGVWIVGGLSVGYLAGFLYRELRTANRPRRRRRNQKYGPITPSEAAMDLARGSYQRDILRGRQRLSGADLRGKASRYGGRYKSSRDRLLSRLAASGIPYEVVGGTARTGPRRIEFAANPRRPVPVKPRLARDALGRLPAHRLRQEIDSLAQAIDDARAELRQTKEPTLREQIERDIDQLEYWRGGLENELYFGGIEPLVDDAYDEGDWVEDLSLLLKRGRHT